MKKAVTLIELLIVLTVIAILAGILIPSFRGYQNEAWLVKAEGDISTLQMAIEAYFRNHDNQYPDALSDLLDENPRFIPQMPKDPFKTDKNLYGYRIVYRKPGDEAFYVIYSNGPNHVTNWQWDTNKAVVTMEEDSDDILITNAIIE